ncbi:MAG TPA: DUF6198 family protein [Lachnospiraceae bacterium]|nr:DUF6198 family protein [Lachnospiraceae bacterium]
MKRKIINVGELTWLLAIVLCSLSVCLSANSGFGVSMIVAPAYILYLKIVTLLPWFTFGMAEYCLQGMLLLVCCMVMKRFKWKYLLSFGTAILYGLCLDFWRLVFGSAIYDILWLRFFSCVAGMIIGSFSIALFLRSYLPQEAYELLVKELSIKTGANMHKVKWIYDISSLGAAILLMFLFFHQFSFEMIGIGTLIVTLLNTPLIAFWGRLIDRYASLNSAFPKFYQKYEELMD